MLKNIDPVLGASPLIRMAIDNQPGLANGAHDEVREIANFSMSQDWQWKEIPRQDFYELVKTVRLVVRCLESAPYACFIFRKGVI